MSFISNPDLAVDKLPQPYRGIVKIFNEVLNSVDETIDRIDKSRKRCDRETGLNIVNICGKLVTSIRPTEYSGELSAVALTPTSNVIFGTADGHLFTDQISGTQPLLSEKITSIIFPGIQPYFEYNPDCPNEISSLEPHMYMLIAGSHSLRAIAMINNEFIPASEEYTLTESIDYISLTGTKSSLLTAIKLKTGNMLMLLCQVSFPRLSEKQLGVYYKKKRALLDKWNGFEKLASWIDLTNIIIDRPIETEARRGSTSSTASDKKGTLDKKSPTKSAGNKKGSASIEPTQSGIPAGQFTFGTGFLYFTDITKQTLNVIDLKFQHDEHQEGCAIQSIKPIAALKIEKFPLSPLTMSCMHALENRLMVGFENGIVAVYEDLKYKPLPGHYECVNDVQLMNDRAVSLSKDGFIHFYDLGTCELVSRMVVHFPYVTNGKGLASFGTHLIVDCGDDLNCRLFNVSHRMKRVIGLKGLQSYGRLVGFGEQGMLMVKDTGYSLIDIRSFYNQEGCEVPIDDRVYKDLDWVVTTRVRPKDESNLFQMIDTIPK